MCLVLYSYMRDDCKAHIGVVLLYSGGKRVLYRIVIETRSDEYFIVYFVTIYVCVNIGLK